MWKESTQKSPSEIYPLQKKKKTPPLISET